VRRDSTALVTEPVLTIFERHASRAEATAEGVLQIMDPHFAISDARIPITSLVAASPPEIQRCW
jgi:hypothetical protein